MVEPVVVSNVTTRELKRIRAVHDEDTAVPSLLLFISVAEEPYFYCYTTPLTDAFTDDVIDKLNLSVPSARQGVIPGCHGPNDEFTSDVWTRVEEAHVKDLTHVGKVVLGFFYE